MAARDRLGEGIDVNVRLKEDGKEEENESIIAALYGESVFYSGVHNCG